MPEPEPKYRSIKVDSQTHHRLRVLAALSDRTIQGIIRELVTKAWARKRPKETKL